MKHPKRWILGDTHFDHKNIIHLTGRPFETVEEMNDFIIKKWNQRVSKQDIVYFIGDFTLSRRIDVITHYVNKLNGKIILVMGNHDTRKPKDYVNAGFFQAGRKPIMVEPDVWIGHEPPLRKHIQPRVKYIHGHTHEKLTDLEDLSNCRCASLERTAEHPDDWGPLNLDELIAEMDYLTIEEYLMLQNEAVE
jgi:calcineurin-like phosphoesterase family protein